MRGFSASFDVRHFVEDSRPQADRFQTKFPLFHRDKADNQSFSPQFEKLQFVWYFISFLLISSNMRQLLILLVLSLVKQSRQVGCGAYGEVHW